VLILLPPSEGKSAPASGPRLSWPRLHHRELTSVREQMFLALTKLCQTSPTKARSILGLGPKQADDIARNAALAKAPTAPAVEVYTGVLFDALDAGTLTAAARRRLDQHVLIASALFGFLSPEDHIPVYRLSGDVTIPGAPMSLWKEPLTHILSDHKGVIVDMRSQTYQKLAPIPPDTAGRSFVVRVFQERNGKRAIVSHHNKATKGRVVRDLVQAARMPKTEAGVLNLLTQLGYVVEVHEGTKAGQPAYLDIILD
jgi:uncharacterized protein